MAATVAESSPPERRTTAGVPATKTVWPGDRSPRAKAVLGIRQARKDALVLLLLELELFESLWSLPPGAGRPGKPAPPELSPPMPGQPPAMPALLTKSAIRWGRSALI